MNRESRTKNSIRNVSIGLIANALSVAVSFVLRTTIVKTLGLDILSLNGLFKELISMLSLFELGAGMAIIYSLYKPISEGDEKKISQLMGLYRTAYYLIAAAIFTAGLFVLLFVDKLVTDIEMPASEIRIIFFLFVIQSASTYLFSYKASLLNADQKQYIVTLINSVVNLIFAIIMVVMLLVFENYYIYLISSIIQSFLSGIIFSIYVDKRYPFIDYKEKLDRKEKREIGGNIANIFVKKVSSIITYSTDNVLISLLIGTTFVGYFSNYSMLYNVFRTILGQITGGVAASIGNLSVTSDGEHCSHILKKLTRYYFLFAMIASAGLMGVCQPFITLWLGEKFTMSDAVLYVTVFVLFLDIVKGPLWQFMEVSGLFKWDKYVGLIGNVVNIFVSIILALYIGIVGIFVGTAVSHLVQMVMKTFLIYRHKFEYPLRSFFALWIRIMITYAVMTTVIYYFVRPLAISDNLFIVFLVKGIISVVIAFVLAFLCFIGIKKGKIYNELLIK